MGARILQTLRGLQDPKSWVPGLEALVYPNRLSDNIINDECRGGATEGSRSRQWRLSPLRDCGTLNQTRNAFRWKP